MKEIWHLWRLGSMGSTVLLLPIQIFNMFIILHSMRQCLTRLTPLIITVISLAFPIQSLMTAVAVGTAIGIGSLFSRSLGEQGRRKQLLSYRNSGRCVRSVRLTGDGLVLFPSDGRCTDCRVRHPICKSCLLLLSLFILTDYDRADYAGSWKTDL